MHWNESRRRIVAGRDDRTEFVGSLDDPSSVWRRVCAFANTEGDVLALGANHDGGIVGVKDNPVEVDGWLDDLLDTGFTAPCEALRPARLRSVAPSVSADLQLHRPLHRMRCAMRAFTGTTPGFENDIENDRFRLMLRLGEEENCQ